MIEKYKHPLLFYSLATLIPWSFWMVAGYISHLTPHTDENLRVASVVAFVGLLGPPLFAYGFIRRDDVLWKDVMSRFFNFRAVRPVYLLLACLLMPASILLAQAVSLLFGYSPEQFVITGHFTF